MAVNLLDNVLEWVLIISICSWGVWQVTDDIWKYVVQCIALYITYTEISTGYNVLAYNECTFWASSWKNSFARSAILGLESSKHIAMELIWPLTFTISLRMRCVSTVSALLLTRGEGSRNLHNHSNFIVNNDHSSVSRITSSRCRVSKVQGG